MLNIANSASLLDAMANPQRLEMLRILAEGEVSVGDLSVKIGLSQSALSQHLSKLRQKRLVRTRREAQTIYYSCEEPAVLKMLAALQDIYAAAPERKRVSRRICILSCNVTDGGDWAFGSRQLRLYSRSFSRSCFMLSGTPCLPGGVTGSLAIA
jgi:DNA-binding transcriptional ArsR family regulator